MKKWFTLHRIVLIQSILLFSGMFSAATFAGTGGMLRINNRTGQTITPVVTHEHCMNQTGHWSAIAPYTTTDYQELDNKNSGWCFFEDNESKTMTLSLSDDKEVTLSILPHMVYPHSIDTLNKHLIFEFDPPQQHNWGYTTIIIEPDDIDMQEHPDVYMPDIQNRAHAIQSLTESNNQKDDPLTS